MGSVLQRCMYTCTAFCKIDYRRVTSKNSREQILREACHLVNYRTCMKYDTHLNWTYGTGVKFKTNNSDILYKPPLQSVGLIV